MGKIGLEFKPWRRYSWRQAPGLDNPPVVEAIKAIIPARFATKNHVDYKSDLANDLDEWCELYTLARDVKTKNKTFEQAAPTLKKKLSQAGCDILAAEKYVEKLYEKIKEHITHNDEVDEMREELLGLSRVLVQVFIEQIAKLEREVLDAEEEQRSLLKKLMSFKKVETQRPAAHGNPVQKAKTESRDAGHERPPNGGNGGEGISGKPEKDFAVENESPSPAIVGVNTHGKSMLVSVPLMVAAAEGKAEAQGSASDKEGKEKEGKEKEGGGKSKRRIEESVNSCCKYMKSSREEFTSGLVQFWFPHAQIFPEEGRAQPEGWPAEACHKFRMLASPLLAEIFRYRPEGFRRVCATLRERRLALPQLSEEALQTISSCISTELPLQTAATAGSSPRPLSISDAAGLLAGGMQSEERDGKRGRAGAQEGGQGSAQGEEDGQPPVKKAKVHDSRTVIVSQVHQDATEEAVKEEFSKCGDVREVQLEADANNAGFQRAQVTFVEPAHAHSALERNKPLFHGHELRVEMNDVEGPRRSLYVRTTELLNGYFAHCVLGTIMAVFFNHINDSSKDAAGFKWKNPKGDWGKKRLKEFLKEHLSSASLGAAPSGERRGSKKDDDSVVSELEHLEKSSEIAEAEQPAVMLQYLLLAAMCALPAKELEDVFVELFSDPHVQHALSSLPQEKRAALAADFAPPPPLYLRDAPPPPPPGRPPGGGWVQYVTADGHPYFHNTRTRATAWELPEGERADAADGQKEKRVRSPPPPPAHLSHSASPAAARPP